jgi:hypothetical protein
MTGEERAEVPGLSALWLSGATLEQTAESVAQLALALRGCDGAGVQMLGAAGLDPSVGTDARSRDLNDLQDAVDDGPGRECLRTGAPLELHPTTPATAWPRFTSTARAAGLLACSALPLRSNGSRVGVLNLYAWEGMQFVGWDRSECDLFAAHAGVGLTNAQSLARNVQDIARLEHELGSPDDVYAEACGVLMERHHQSLSEARAQLAKAASQSQSSIDAEAQRVVKSLG